MNKETRIIIADDHAIFRTGLRHTIESYPNYKIIADASDGETALGLILEQKPDVVILDVSMPKSNGFQVAEELKRKIFPVKIVFLTMHDDEAMFNRAMDLDVKGYVLKDSAASDILNCLHAVTNDKNFTSPALTTYLFKRATDRNNETHGTLNDLTATERKILKLVAEYKTSKEIAAELFISYRTIENYRTNICSKFNLHGSHALMKFALEHKNKI